jgi:MFS family permease
LAPYRRLWASTAVTAIGSQLTAVAVPKQVYDLTGSSAYVGLAAAFALVPLVVFALWGGSVADVVDRRKLMLVTNTGIAATSILLWAQAVAHLNSVWVVLVLLAAQQTFYGANQPTRGAAIARLVPKDLLPAAQALGMTVLMFGGVFGPLAAGALIPVLGLATLYLIDAIFLTVTIWAVWRLPALPSLVGSARRPGVAHVLAGFRYLATRNVLLASMLIDLIAMIFGLPRALYPEVAERTFHDPTGGGVALGVLFAAGPIGAMVCGLFSGRLSHVRRHGVGVTVAVCAWGLAVIGFGLSPWLWPAAACLALGGAADMISGVYRSTMLQVAATDEMRGRLQGVFVVVVIGGPRLGDVLHGTVGAVLGTRFTTVAGGVLVVLATVLAVALLPGFWRYRSDAASSV